MLSLLTVLTVIYCNSGTQGLNYSQQLTIFSTKSAASALVADRLAKAQGCQFFCTPCTPFQHFVRIFRCLSEIRPQPPRNSNKRRAKPTPRGAAAGTKPPRVRQRRVEPRPVTHGLAAPARRRGRGGGAPSARPARRGVHGPTRDS